MKKEQTTEKKKGSKEEKPQEPNVKRSKDGTFQKGTGKVEGSGRKKGTPNRSSTQLRQFFGVILCEEIENDHIKDALDQLYQDNPKYYLDAIIKLAQFNVPALAAIETINGDGDAENPFTSHMRDIAGLSQKIDDKDR